MIRKFIFLLYQSSITKVITFYPVVLIYFEYQKALVPKILVFRLHDNLLDLYVYVVYPERLFYTETPVLYTDF